MNKRRLLDLIILVGSLTFLVSCGSEKSEKPKMKHLNILVLLDKDNPDTYNERSVTKVSHFMAVSNKIYKNSGLNIEVKVIKQIPYAFKHNDSTDVLDDIAFDKDISKIRDELNADFVVAYRKYANDGLCGVAYVNKYMQASHAFAHVALECPAETTAHELGHGMGLSHSIKDKSSGIYTYARGYGVENRFVTVMAYGKRYNTKNVVYNYSSPTINHKGLACGVDAADEVNGADAVKVLKSTAATAENFR